MATTGFLDSSRAGFERQVEQFQVWRTPRAGASFGNGPFRSILQSGRHRTRSVIFGRRQRVRLRGQWGTYCPIESWLSKVKSCWRGRAAADWQAAWGQVALCACAASRESPLSSRAPSGKWSVCSQSAREPHRDGFEMKAAAADESHSNASKMKAIFVDPN